MQALCLKRVRNRSEFAIRMKNRDPSIQTNNENWVEFLNNGLVRKDETIAAIEHHGWIVRGCANNILHIDYLSAHVTIEGGFSSYFCTKDGVQHLNNNRNISIMGNGFTFFWTDSKNMLCSMTPSIQNMMEMSNEASIPDQIIRHAGIFATTFCLSNATNTLYTAHHNNLELYTYSPVINHPGKLSRKRRYTMESSLEIVTICTSGDNLYAYCLCARPTLIVLSSDLQSLYCVFYVDNVLENRPAVRQLGSCMLMHMAILTTNESTVLAVCTEDGDICFLSIHGGILYLSPSSTSAEELQPSLSSHHYPEEYDIPQNININVFDDLF